jgi:outer membrane lipoprotein carrier protein
MKRLAGVFFLLFLFAAPLDTFGEGAAQDITVVLGELENTMKEIKTVQADFIQEKNLALFEQKIVLKGKVFIQKPDLLSWRVFTPLRYSMVMRGAMISQWDEDTNKVQSVSLDKNPSFQVAIAQMQNWFCGAYTSMQGDYTIVAVSKRPLVLEFTPKENALARNFITRVTVSFQDDSRYLKELRIEEKSGDSTGITFMNTLLNQPIPPKSWEVKADAR